MRTDWHTDLQTAVAVTVHDHQTDSTHRKRKHCAGEPPSNPQMAQASSDFSSPVTARPCAAHHVFKSLAPSRLSVAGVVAAAASARARTALAAAALSSASSACSMHVCVNICGDSTVTAWPLHGPYTVAARSLHGHSMATAWSLHGRSLHGHCMVTAQSLSCTFSHCTFTHCAVSDGTVYTLAVPPVDH